MSKQVNRELEKISSLWDTAEAKTVGGSNLPDDDYECKLEGMELGVSKTGGRLQVVSTFKVMDGTHTGRTILKFDGLDTEVGISFFKGYALALGLEVPRNINDLENAIKVFKDSFNDVCVITLKTKGEWQNVYLKSIKTFAQ